ncbi:Carbonic anhydrase [Eumeta japonica]|uniref:Carbonic anhydrase n=1 Tax=Eumeta variegata TaxID=151549 RepID=A0A4C1USS5_EUMVA|nr:Carbonic anhydrase [Eumeta japonica]
MSGPATWVEKFPEAGGARQSPVDIASAHTRPVRCARPLAWRYSVAHTRSVVNPGYCWRVDENGYDSELSGGPLGCDVYRLQQWHCHWGAVDGEGSEHTVDGCSFSGELHLVHWNTTKYNSFVEAAGQPDGLAVLGVFLTVSAYNLSTFIEGECGLGRLLTDEMNYLRQERAKRSWLKDKETSQTIANPGLTRNKLMLCVWWDWKVHYELLPPGKTIKSDLYCHQLIRLKQEVEKKTTGFNQ